MQLFNYIEINIFAFLILILIYFNTQHRLEKCLFSEKLFLALLISNAVILFFDTAMWAVDGKVVFLARQTNIFVTTVYYILNTIPCMLWSIYADFQIYRDEKRIKKLLIPLMIPVCINGILAIFGNSLFYIDTNNIYHRGNLFAITVGICYMYFIYTFIEIIAKKNTVRKSDYFPLLMFAFPPFIGGILQSIFYGISLIWICMSFSLLIIFISIQNNRLYTDHLTGLFNRRQLDNYLTEKIKNNVKGKLLAGIMIDINSFKKINDTYGHDEGDRALEYTSSILKNSFRKDDFVSRYGGDEFAIVIEIDKSLDLINAVNRLQENIKKFNDKKITPYKISLSMGYDTFNYKSAITAQQFLKHIDNLMYKNKKIKKELSISS